MPLTVSVIILTHAEERLPMLDKILRGLAAQTYRHLEVIVVGNGVPSRVHSYLAEWEAAGGRRRFLAFEDDAWSYEDHSASGRLRYQPAVQMARGELVFLQSDDDFVAPDFFERMVALFEENPECKTAIGLPASYYWATDRAEFPKGGSWKRRPKYMPGKDLVLAWMRDASFHPNPGFCFVTRKELFLAACEDVWYGYDTSVLLGIVPEGITGFDPLALMYWGRHGAQEHFEFNRQHYRNLAYARHAAIKERFIAGIWSRVATAAELKTVLQYERQDLAVHSTQSAFMAFGEKEFILAFRHLRQPGVPREVLYHFRGKARTLLRRIARAPIYGLLAIARVRQEAERMFVQWLRTNRMHRVRQPGDPGIDVTFIEYEPVAHPPDQALMELAGAAGLLLVSDWRSDGGESDAPGLGPLFDFGNHYMLLSAIAKARRAKKIVEIGTGGGASLWAWLRADCVSSVQTWDLNPLSELRNELPNADCMVEVAAALHRESERWTQFVEDLSLPEVWKQRSSEIADADIVFVDGPGDGVFEAKLWSAVASLPNTRDILLILSRIRVSSMVDRWNELQLPKLDISFIGHQSGTGIALLKGGRMTRAAQGSRPAFTPTP